MANLLFNNGTAYSISASQTGVVYPSGADANENINIIHGFNKYEPPNTLTPSAMTNDTYGGGIDYNNITYTKRFFGYIDGLQATHWFTTASNITQYRTVKLFYQDTIEIPPASINTKFRAHIILENSVIPGYERVVTGNGVELSPGQIHYEDAQKTSVPDGEFGFRVVAEGTETVICSKEGDFNGEIFATIPPGTTTLRLETYEVGNSDSFSQTSLINAPNFNFFISNPRVYKDGTPSLGIDNRTDWDTTKEYIQPNRVASLSIHNIPESGYYTVISDQVQDGNPVDYFVVGDELQPINYVPFGRVRNACIEFQNVNISLIDPDQPIELVFDLVDIDTVYVEEAYDHLVQKHRLEEWHKKGDRTGLGIQCGVGIVAGVTSDAYFPGEAAGNNNNNYGGLTHNERMVIDIHNSQGAINFFTLDNIKPGLNYLDITNHVRNAIISNEPTILLWLKFYGGDTTPGSNKNYAWIDYHIGNKESNKPRIRYRPELQPLH